MMREGCGCGGERGGVKVKGDRGSRLSLRRARSGHSDEVAQAMVIGEGTAGK